MIVPPVSLAPKRPTFKVPVAVLDEAMVMALDATLPPLATVSVPLPRCAILRAPLLVQVEAAPVTSTELFKALVSCPMIPLLFSTLPPSEITKLLPRPS